MQKWKLFKNYWNIPDGDSRALKKARSPMQLCRLRSQESDLVYNIDSVLLCGMNEWREGPVYLFISRSGEVEGSLPPLQPPLSYHLWALRFSPSPLVIFICIFPDCVAFKSTYFPLSNIMLSPSLLPSTINLQLVISLQPSS